MSRGILFYAHNNRTIDYGKIALANSCLIKKHMKNNSVTIVTDEGTANWLYKAYDKDFVDSKIDNIMVERRRNTPNKKRYYDTRYSKQVETFYNINRHNSFNYSPYDETLILDVDYMICNNQFDMCWDLDYDIQINRHSKDIFSTRKFEEFSRIGEQSINFYWATAVFFRRTKEAEMLFDTVNHVQQNYQYYKLLYHFDAPTFRNDFAFSIAIHLLNGMANNNFVKPLPVPFLQHSHGFDDFIDVEGTKFKFLLEKPNNPGDYLVCQTQDTNIHVMNKFALNRLSDKIIKENS